MDVLPPVVPAGLHQHHSVQSASSTPGASAGVGRFTFKGVLYRDEACTGCISPGDTQIAAYMGEDRDVHIIKVAVTCVVGFGSQLLLGHSLPEDQGSRDIFTFHDLLDSQCCRDIQRNSRVMTLAVTRCPLYNGIVPGDSRLLRRFGDSVDVTAKSDHWFTRTPPGKPGSLHTGDPVLDVKPVLFEYGGEIGGGLLFMKTELCKAEDLVDHNAGLFMVLLNLFGHFALELPGLAAERLCCDRRSGEIGHHHQQGHDH